MWFRSALSTWFSGFVAAEAATAAAVAAAAGLGLGTSLLSVDGAAAFALPDFLSFCLVLASAFACFSLLLADSFPAGYKYEFEHPLSQSVLVISMFLKCNLDECFF